MTKKLIEPTPGEWIISDRYGRMIGNDIQMRVRYTDLSTDDPLNLCVDPLEAQANAKMMKASKEMYQALKLARSELAAYIRLGITRDLEVIPAIDQAIEAAELWVDDE